MAQRGTATNDVTNAVLEYLIRVKRCYAWRQNTVGIFDPATGRYRTAPKRGVSDILAVCPPDGRFVGIEVKRRREALRPDQSNFLEGIKRVGGIALVVRDVDEAITALKTL